MIQYNHESGDEYMKKVLPLLALIGGAAALVAYKMKKDEQKKIADLDEGLLYDDAFIKTDDTLNSTNEKNLKEDNVENLKAFRDDEVCINKDEDKNEDYDETYTHLTKDEMSLLKEDTDARITSLYEKNDIHIKERPIQHHLQFLDENQLNQFKNEVINRGYVITRGTCELELIVLHITPIDPVKIMANIYYLADVAAIYNGIYKGWESRVVTE